MSGKASIIIRTKNEEKWIASCLSGILDQSYENWEIILVDNQSIDKTVEKAKQFPLQQIVTIDEYRPGKALNKGIRLASGKYIVCLSGHCIPVNEYWLENLEKNFDTPEIAGVYGNQEPLSFTPDQDKRDLNIIFGKEHIEKTVDDFFHNANSMIRRDIWQKYPFDEDLTNLEDRAWAQKVLDAGYKTVYEPEASVYHYHGIHHNGDKERAKNHIRILEKLSDEKPNYQYRDSEELNVVSIIPKKGPPQNINDRPLISYTIDQSVKSPAIDQTIVSTDNDDTITTAEKYGAEVPFKRDSSLSEEYIDLQKVYNYTLEQLETTDIYPDILVLLEPTYPFRSPGLIENMVTEYIHEGLDTLVAGYFENKPIFQEDENNEIKMINEGIIPRKYQDATYVGLRGLGCAVSPHVIRQGEIYGQNSGIYDVDSPLARTEIRNSKDTESLIVKDALGNLENRWNE